MHPGAKIRARYRKYTSGTCPALLAFGTECGDKAEREYREREAMDELINRVSAATGLDAATAEKAIALILGFLAKEGPPEDVAALSGAIPGAQAAIDLAEAEEGGGGLGSRMMGMMGGGGGLMGLAGKLSGLGLGMDQMQSAGREIFSYCKEKVGEERLGRIAGSIPGLSQFV
jgi:hypothetical protein